VIKRVVERANAETEATLAAVPKARGMVHRQSTAGFTTASRVRSHSHASTVHQGMILPTQAAPAATDWKG